MSEDQIVALLGSVVIPLIFLIGLGTAEALVQATPVWAAVKDVAWDMCVLGIGLTGGLFSDREFARYYARYAPLLTAGIIGLDLLFGIVILVFKKRHHLSPAYGKFSVILGFVAVAMPASLLIWRF
jgi:hypothetical protein